MNLLKLEATIQTDVTVNRMVRDGCSAEEIIVALAEEKAFYIKRAIDLRDQKVIIVQPPSLQQPQPFEITCDVTESVGLPRTGKPEIKRRFTGIGM